MALNDPKDPYSDLNIPKATSGFYKGYSLPIALISKGVMVALVLWALIWPLRASGTLDRWNTSLLGTFNEFYIIIVGLFTFFLFALAILPTGRRRLGEPGSVPEFSRFSWFSMMFGAGLGVGLMVFASAEPMGLWGSNPEIVAGNVVGNTKEALPSAYRYTFLHYGFHAWGIYVITGLSLAYFAYTRNMPLTIRSVLTPLLGRAVNGPLGHIVDIIGVVATILGVSVTIGFGVSQFVDGVYAVTGMEWLMNSAKEGVAPKPSTVGLLVALLLIMIMSVLSAVSGVGRGIKYLSNLNLVLSIILLMTFVIFGSFLFAMTTYASAIVDYFTQFASLSFEAYSLEKDGGATEKALFEWQSGWTTFYWAWWISFSPFVGLFLARISKGRTVREFILGCAVIPALVCFAWMTIVGGTAIDLELTGGADGAIMAASNTNKLFVTLEQILSGGFLSGITIMCVVLIMTFIVTSADSGILVMNTIMSGGEPEAGVKHRIIWGIIMTLVIGALLIAGNSGSSGNPLESLKDAMIIGALPFAFVMVLMVISLIKAMINDRHQEETDGGKASVIKDPN